MEMNYLIFRLQYNVEFVMYTAYASGAMLRSVKIPRPIFFIGRLFSSVATEPTASIISIAELVLIIKDYLQYLIIFVESTCKFA